MKEINEAVRKNYPLVRLYQNDIKEMVDILENEKLEKICIQTKNKEFEANEPISDDDYKNIQRITAYRPIYFSVDFQDRFGVGVNIYSSTNTVQALGLIHKVEDVIYKRKRRYYSIVVNPHIFLPSLIGAQIIISFLNIKHILSEKGYWIAMGIDAIFFVVLMLLASGYLFRKNILYPKSKSQMPNFFERKKDDIFVGIFLCIIAFLLGRLSK